MDIHLLAGLSLLFGLAIGSFLNVVIHRLPIMLERAWQAEAAALAGQDETAAIPFNLAVPPSRCPACERPIRAGENIPLLSFLVLRGRCPGCGNPISWRYPLVELVCGLLFAGLAWHWGMVWTLPLAMGAAAMLVALAAIDAEHRLLPDQIVLPLLWCGLLANLSGAYAPLDQAVLGAMAGYGVLWLVSRAYRRWRGRTGMGDGDLKLFAALGAWFGWTALAPILLGASVLAIAALVALAASRRRDLDGAIPFGPFLALAGLVVLLGVPRPW